MWVMTLDGGFLSTVQDSTNPERLVVRSRTHADALTYARFHAQHYGIDSTDDDIDASLVIMSHPDADYPWRVFSTREAFTAYLADAVANLDYGNFKAAVGRAHPAHAKAYGHVWEALLDLEREDPFWSQEVPLP